MLIFRKGFPMRGRIRAAFSVMPLLRPHRPLPKGVFSRLAVLTRSRAQFPGKAGPAMTSGTLREAEWQDQMGSEIPR